MDKTVEEDIGKYITQRISNENKIGFSVGESQMKQKTKYTIAENSFKNQEEIILQT